MLAERERIDLDARIQEFDFERHVFDGALLSDKLVHPRLSNFARAICAGVGPVIATGCAAIQTESEAKRRTAVSRTQYHVEVAAVKSESNPAGSGLKHATLGTDFP
jgi:hypothetical protein